MVGEVVYIDATVRQNSLFAVDVTDAGGSGNNALKTLGRVRRGYAGHTPSQELQMISVAGPRGISTRVRNPLLYAKMGLVSKHRRYLSVALRAYTKGFGLIRRTSRRLATFIGWSCFMKRVFFPVVFLCLVALGPRVHADEGMWLFNAFPKQRVKTKYGFEPTQHWLDH